MVSTFRNISFDWNIDNNEVSAKMTFPWLTIRQVDGEGVSSSSIIRDAYNKFLNGTEIIHSQLNTGNYNILTLTVKFESDEHDHKMTLHHFNKLITVIYNYIDFHINRVINHK